MHPEHVPFLVREKSFCIWLIAPDDRPGSAAGRGEGSDRVTESGEAVCQPETSHWQHLSEVSVTTRLDAELTSLYLDSQTHSFYSFYFIYFAIFYTILAVPLCHRIAIMRKEVNSKCRRKINLKITHGSERKTDSVPWQSDGIIKYCSCGFNMK